jgi:branched-chain amino acid transport system substrate-binding protein
VGVIKAMEAAKIDSPRGPWTLSKAHNPVQDMYLRKVVGKENKNMGVAWKALADPARGCKA